MTRLGWIDATGGVSGDMLLGACIDAGAPLDAVQAAIDTLGLPESVTLSVGRTTRSGLAAARVDVAVAPAEHHRRLPDVLELLRPLPQPLREPAAAVFEVLARAEARVHGIDVDRVHFHEVGALDSIADVVGVVAALDALALDRLECSPLALGAGRARTAHGLIPVPVPAVLELLRESGAPGHGDPVDMELATPTGVALMVTLARSFGPMPPVVVSAVGVGAGERDPEAHTNVTRLVLGTAASGTAPATAREDAVVLEANVDDLDPRVWPGVLDVLLAAGAADAWLVPVLMKKGRPAHVLSVLAAPDRAADLERLVLQHTTTIGVRRHAVDRQVLDRELVTVDVLGAPVRVKVARLEGAVVNAVPEFEDVARLAAELSLPVKTVLAAAVAAADAADGLRARD